MHTIRNSTNKHCVKLFWTGGWDSTFRVCYLLQNTDFIIQPYYLIDLNRSSYPVEIRTMNSLKIKLENQFGSDRILPVKFFCVNDLEPDAKITDMYLQVRSPIGLGNQYSWMARFLEQYNIADMEVSIEKGRIYNYLSKYLEVNTGVAGTYHTLKEEYYNTKFGIFKNMRFPLITVTRDAMISIAKQHGFIQVLNNTWFCHRPVCLPFQKPLPCGGCNPCISAIKDGFGYRIPLITRISGKYLKKVYNSSIFQPLVKLVGA